MGWPCISISVVRFCAVLAYFLLGFFAAKAYSRSFPPNGDGDLAKIGFCFVAWPFICAWLIGAVMIWAATAILMVIGEVIDET